MKKITSVILLSFFFHFVTAGLKTVLAQTSVKKTFGQQTAAVSRNRPFNFTLKTLDGKVVRLNDYRSKIVLVTIWAPWCGPCRAETPGFVSLYKEYHEKGFEIIGVAVNTNEAEVKSFVSKYDVRWPVGIGESVAASFGTTGIPDNYLFCPDGTILKHWVGFTPKEELERAIKNSHNKPS